MLRIGAQNPTRQQSIQPTAAARDRAALERSAHGVVMIDPRADHARSLRYR
jgi:hypothetical protein